MTAATTLMQEHHTMSIGTVRMTQSLALRRQARLLLLAIAAVGTVSCKDRMERGKEADSIRALSADTALDAGMAHMGTMNRTAPRDSNHAFLRMMVDHHAGIVALSDSAGPRLGSSSQPDAQAIGSEQRSEQQRLLAMLSSQYGDQAMPVPMPGYHRMMDSLRQAPPGTDADRAYYRQVIAHHQEGVRMIERMTPHLSGEMRAMAETMRASMRREMDRLQRRAVGG
jgi:uncharacterized protein (DUF305 family)